MTIDLELKMKKISKKDFILNDDPIDMTPGQMLATLRALQELTQNQLAEMTGMSQAKYFQYGIRKTTNWS